MVVCRKKEFVQNILQNTFLTDNLCQNFLIFRQGVKNVKRFPCGFWHCALNYPDGKISDSDWLMNCFWTPNSDLTVKTFSLANFILLMCFYIEFIIYYCVVHTRNFSIVFSYIDTLRQPSGGVSMVERIPMNNHK